MRKAGQTKKGEAMCKPITDEYIEKMAGVLRTKGKLLKALTEEKAKERLNARHSIRTKRQEQP